MTLLIFCNDICEIFAHYQKILQKKLAFFRRLCYNGKSAPVAQSDRVFGYEPKGQGFESLPACHLHKEKRTCP